MADAVRDHCNRQPPDPEYFPLSMPYDPDALIPLATPLERRGFLPPFASEWASDPRPPGELTQIGLSYTTRPTGQTLFTWWIGPPFSIQFLGYLEEPEPGWTLVVAPTLLWAAADPISDDWLPVPPDAPDVLGEWTPTTVPEDHVIDYPLAVYPSIAIGAHGRYTMRKGGVTTWGDVMNIRILP